MTHKISINNDNIIFLDLDVSVQTKKIHELGMVYKNRQHNTPAIQEATNFLKLCNAKYICGHNFIDFDLCNLEDFMLGEDWYINLFRLSHYARAS